MASAAFIFFLGCTALTFGIREVRRKKENRFDHPWFGSKFWRYYHFGCVGLMVAAGIWIYVTMKVHHGHPYWGQLAGEWGCAFGFGASWTAKGAEWRYLFGGSTADEREARAELARRTGATLDSPTEEAAEVPPETGAAPVSG